MPEFLAQKRVLSLWTGKSPSGAALVLRDGTSGLLLFVGALLPLGIRGLDLGELHHDVSLWLTVTFTFGQTFGLALRRLRPAAALLVVGLSFAAAELSGANTGLAGIGLLIAIYSFAAYQRVRRIRLTLVAIAAYVALVVMLHLAGSPETVVDWVTFVFVLSAPWLVGALVRRRMMEQAAREARVADLAVRMTKNELARDLHDVVTHHVTAIVVQADSSSYLDPDDVAERQVRLQSIAGTGRRALQELRSLLGALEQSPQGAATVNQPRVPTSTDVSALVDEIHATGYPITLAQDATPELSRAVALTLYRVAQEATTNAMKHAAGEPIAIRLATAGDRIELTVENNTESGEPGRPGRGRRGIADRVSVLGGAVEIDVIGSRYRVKVSIDPQAELR